MVVNCGFFNTGIFANAMPMMVMPQISFANPFAGSLFASPMAYCPVPTFVPPVFNPIMNFFNNFIPTFPTFNFNTNFAPATNPKPQGVGEFITEGYAKAKNFGKKVINKISNFASSMVANAKKYLGYNEKDGSYKKFTQGRTEAWCADFVSYVARESGKTGFNFPSVQGIWDWGVQNGKFSKTAKVGDAVIFKGVDKKGKRVSHTGIVTSIENGKIKTIEGNASNKVCERTYDLNDSKITGYVSIA